MADKTVHIMVDLEALGNEPHNGVLIAIGAIGFTMNEDIQYPNTEDFNVCTRYGKFFYPIDLAGQSEHYGFIVEDDTLKWWLAKERVSQLIAFIDSNEKELIRNVFEKFEWWVNSICTDRTHLILWSHGVTYDCVHLAQKWPIVLKQSFNRICPFRQMRDTRTIFAAYEQSFGKTPYQTLTHQRLRHHHPLEDAYVQAVAVQVAWKGLTRG